MLHPGNINDPLHRGTTLLFHPHPHPHPHLYTLAHLIRSKSYPPPHCLSVSLTSAAIAVVLDVDVNRVIEIAAEFLRLFLGQSITGNH